MKAVYLFILSISVCFFSKANVQPAYFTRVSSSAFGKTACEQKGKAVEIDANAISISAHAACRSLGDGKFSAAASFPKTCIATIYSRNTFSDCFYKAYLQHIYPTHTIW